MERFPGWKIWPGPTTRIWWAMAPRALRLPHLLEAKTTGGLADQIAMHQRPAACDDESGEPGAATLPSRRLDGEPHPVRLARRLVDEALATWGAGQWTDNGRIVVSELVTNATRHGSPPIFLTLSLHTDPG